MSEIDRCFFTFRPCAVIRAQEAHVSLKHSIRVPFRLNPSFSSIIFGFISHVPIKYVLEQ